VGAGVCLSPGPAQALEPYTSYDNFNSTNDLAESQSYRHSIFWPQGAFPPAEPYLYYYSDPESEQERELGFGDRHGVLAFLGYRFIANEPEYTRAVSGILTVDVRFPNDTSVPSSGLGRLGYQVSADGVEWSEPVELGHGDGQEIVLKSVWGTCHIVFFGTNVLIDNLSVRLSPKPATHEVPDEYATIQDAIDAADRGDIIQVAPGDYDVQDSRGIRFSGKAITVRSEKGPGETRIHFSRGRGFYFGNKEGSDSVLRGFTITGGRAFGSPIPSDADDWKRTPDHSIGGGIFCDDLSSPTIVNCVIRDCAAELGGGIGIVNGSPAIYGCVIKECQAGGRDSNGSRGFGGAIGLIGGADAKILDCVLKNNRAYSNSLGAGLYCRKSSARLVNCDISGNSAQGSVTGGGVYCGGAGASVFLDQCLITNNAAETGAGVFAEGFHEARLTNCTVANNRLSGSMSSAGGIRSVDGDIEIENSIVYYNDGTQVSLSNPVSPNPVSFSNVEGYYHGQGNIAEDPCFASPDPDTGDYHLKSITGRYDPGSGWVDDFLENVPLEDIHSPCIDAGDPQGLVGAEPFPNRGRVNMGAYGGTAEASKSIGPLIFHVDVDEGRDSNSGLNKSNAFKTINRAVDLAFDGDIILVWPGVYREALEINDKALTLQSAAEAAVIAAPNQNDFTSYGVAFQNAGAGSVLRNFIITDCAIAGIYCDSALPTLVNLTVTGNQFGMEAWGAVPTVTSCIFWGNTDGDLNMNVRPRYSCLQQRRPLDAENHNISTDPLFADPANGDYHLQSENGRYVAGNSHVIDEQTSPCIDTGDPDTYAGRELMPHGGTVNMGAYGGTPFASLSGSRQMWDDFTSGLPFELSK
jgi:hypothetical protein